MKTILLITLFISSFSMASSVTLSCTPTEPCKHMGKGMPYCLSTVALSGPINGYGEEIVNFKPASIGQEVKLRPQKHSVLFSTKIHSIGFRSQDGDQWGEIFMVVGGKHRGRITVDQDFEFVVTCQ